MIRMYGFWRSAASFRVRIALNLKGLPYEEVMVDIDAGEQHAADYLAMNAQSVVPSLLVDDGPPLTQSLAILEYLEETHPQPALLPADARGRSRVRSLALLFAADHHPLIVPRVRRYLSEELQIGEAGRTAWIRHWFREGLVQAERRLAAELGTGRFCHGDTPGMADACLVPQVYNAVRWKLPMDDYPTIRRIHEACEALPAFQRAAPEAQPDAPAAA